MVTEKNVTREPATESSLEKDVREFIEMVKELDDKSRQRTLGYMDALRSFGDQLAQTA